MSDTADLVRWLTNRVGELTGAAAAEVPVDQPFNALGLDSARLTELAGELEQRLGRRVDPTVGYAYPTIAKLAIALTAPIPSVVRTRARPESEPIAVVGLACRMPGAPDAEAFWRLLDGGVDAVGPLPADRSAGTQGLPPAGTLADLAGFDARFFRFTAAEADRMDPQQRLLLEVCWEALEDAGSPPERLRGSDTGVFLGISETEYLNRQLADPAGIDRHTATGGARSVAAGRIAYLFDLHGPVLGVDTACSSSLVALHLAVRALRAGDCGTALVAGVNALLDPELTLSLQRAGMLAPDGRCKAFDSRADGYGRGEGCGVVVLRPLSAAVADGDRIYALVRGSAVNSDGASNGLTAPSPAAQRAVLAAAYADGGVVPDSVDYVECHGTGTLLGDPIEAAALGAVVGGARTNPCLIGSVKTNVGHLEAAAGMAGLIKVCLSLHHGRVPASLHVLEPNPHIDFDAARLRVATTAVDLPGARLAGVSSFGFSGTNAHAVLASPPVSAIVEPGRAVLPLSARTPEGLQVLRQRFADLLGESNDVTAIARTAAVRRTHHRPYRLAVPTPTAERLAAAVPLVPRTTAATAGQPRLLYVCSGQGSQYAGMARDLLEVEPLFRSVVRRCDEEMDWSVEAVLRGDDPRDLADTSVAQPVTVAVQVALAELLRGYGVMPAAVVGHSVGEISAAVISGALPLGAGIRLAVRRGLAMAAPGGAGGMLAVGISAEEAEKLADGDVSVAAVNSPGTCVLSGDQKALGRVRTRLSADGVLARWVKVEYAFHSPRMASAAEALRLVELEPSAEPVVPFWSTVTAAPVTVGELTASYWSQGIRQRVRFADAVAAAVEGLSGIDASVELGGHPVLTSALRQLTSLQLESDGNDGFDVLHAIDRDRDDSDSFLQLLAGAYELGAAVRWDRLGPAGQPVSLPPYPWQHERHWIERPERTLPGGRPLLGAPVDLASGEQKVWESALSSDSVLADHLVGGTVLLPAAGYLELALAAAAHVGRESLREVQLVKPMTLDRSRSRVQTTLQPRDDAYEVTIDGRTTDQPWARFATARAITAGPAPVLDLTTVRARCPKEMPSGAVYAELAEQGLLYGPAFRGLAAVYGGDGEALAKIQVGSEQLPGVRAMDAAIQLIAAVSPAGWSHSAGHGPAVPVSVAEVTRWSDAANAVLAHARVRAVDGDELTADIVLADADGKPCVQINGLRVRRTGRTTVQEDGLWRYDLQWLPAARADRTTAGAGRWLILPDQGGVGAALAEQLTARGADVAVGEFDPATGPYTGVVHLGGLDDDVDLNTMAQLIQAASYADTPTIVAATRGCHPVAGVPTAMPTAAPIWGLCKTSPMENPTLPVRCVDLDPAACAKDAAADLLGELVPAPRTTDPAVIASIDTEVAYRAGQRYVRRLGRADRIPGELNLDGSGVYVVTGGSGALGLAVAGRLLERGAGTVALISRGPLKDTAAPVLKAGGERVVALQADVADEQALATAFAKLRENVAIKGVVHAAGVLEDGALLELTGDSLRRVLAPKMAGGWNLHELTKDDPLDFWVAFSSAASVLGSPGQANYGAANAYLDSLAAFRRSQGLPAVSIGWGPWAASELGEGMAGGAGISSISPRQGLDEFERLATGPSAHLVVLPFDIRDLLQFYPASLGTAFFTEIADESVRSLKSIGVGSGARPDLRTPYQPPADEVARRIAAIWQKSLGIEPVGANDNFFELGGDSVFGNQILVEINRALGVTLDPERAFENFTVAALARLAEQEQIRRLERMTDDEAARLLGSPTARSES